MVDKLPNSNLLPNQQPWGRAIEKRINDSEREQKRIIQDLVNANKQLSGTVGVLAQQVRTATQVVPYNSTVTNFGLTGSGYQSFAYVELTVPPGKNVVNLLALGSVSVLANNGAPTTYARISTNANQSIAFPAAKDAGASMVNNVIYPTLSVIKNYDEFGTGDVIPVYLEISATNYLAYPQNVSNFASLTVLAFYSSSY